MLLYNMQYTCANSITLLDIQLHAVYFVHICMYMPLCTSYVPLVHFGSYSQTNVSIKKYMLHCNFNSCGDLRDTSKKYSGLFLKDRLWRPQLLMKRSIGRCVSFLVSEKLKGKAFEPWHSLCLHGFDIIWRFWSTWVCCTSNWPCHGPSCQMKRRSCKLLLWMMKLHEIPFVTLRYTESFVVLQDSAIEAEKLFAEVFPDSSKLDASQLEKHYSVSRQMHFFRTTSDYHTVPYREGGFIHWNKIQRPKKIQFDGPPNFHFRQGLCHGPGRHPGSFNLRVTAKTAKTAETAKTAKFCEDF